MKLLTLNVHAWMEENQLSKMGKIAETIALKQYDVIALQEVNQSIDSPIIQNDLKKDNFGLLLQEKINALSPSKYDYVWSNSHIGYSVYDEGIAILTKLPVKDIDSFYCSTSQDVHSIHSRKIVGVTVSYNDELIDIYSCHINLPDTPGEHQIDNIEHILYRNENRHLKILMGDFNVDAFSNPVAYEAIKEIGLWDSYELAILQDEGITVPANIDGWQDHLNGKRLDYIFLSQRRSVQSSRVIFNGVNESVVSDHYGVEIELL
ncbi:endonuclease/exonuclease/phosphatase family protein [Atopobacter phocae]|uniref:endonuclease/exonuclease/phosphatase family protein n=1 Tax=Atopobacter phocae TaxID=136492 RepID=UPI0004718902|nr:endonuclease/exonuclease/phosphatase family protein [Atopobacter phocae]